MKSPAFQFYPDDFVGGVADMTQSEVGAYILLLCAQWGRGEIPLDPERAALIAKGPVSSHVLAKFPGGKNPRLEKVRANLDAYRSAQADNGKAGAEKRWGRHSDAIAMLSPENSGAKVSPMARNSSPTPTPTPTPTPDLQLTTPDTRSIEPKAASLPDLSATIYDAYPRKVGKQDALKAIANALKLGRATGGTDAAKLLTATRAYAAAVTLWPEHERCFVPHPATWFNRGSYEDDPRTWERKTVTLANGRAQSDAHNLDHSKGF